MFLQCFSEDEDVIQVHAYMPLHDEVLKYFVHHGLECSRAVGESKEHYQGFEESTIGVKRCLPLIPFLDANFVVTPLDIELGEVLHASELIISSEMIGSG